MKRSGGASCYAKKQHWLRNATNADAALCRALGEPVDRRLFGFNIAAPKPWV